MQINPPAGGWALMAGISITSVERGDFRGNFGRPLVMVGSIQNLSQDYLENADVVSAGYGGSFIHVK